MGITRGKAREAGNISLILALAGYDTVDEPLRSKPKPVYYKDEPLGSKPKGYSAIITKETSPKKGWLRSKEIRELGFNVGSAMGNIDNYLKPLIEQKIILGPKKREWYSKGRKYTNGEWRSTGIQTSTKQVWKLNPDKFKELLNLMVQKGKGQEFAMTGYFKEQIFKRNLDDFYNELYGGVGVKTRKSVRQLELQKIEEKGKIKYVVRDSLEEINCRTWEASINMPQILNIYINDRNRFGEFVKRAKAIFDYINLENEQRQVMLLLLDITKIINKNGGQSKELKCTY